MYLVIEDKYMTKFTSTSIVPGKQQKHRRYLLFNTVASLNQIYDQMKSATASPTTRLASSGEFNHMIDDTVYVFTVYIGACARMSTIASYAGDLFHTMPTSCNINFVNF